MIVSFEVPGEPMALPRARVEIRKSRSGKAYPHHYTPDEAKRYENHVHFYALQAGLRKHFGPVSIKITATFERPVFMTDGNQEAWPASRIQHTAKPDGDNIAKIVLDGLRRFFHDDSQVFEIEIVKVWADLAFPKPMVRVVVHCHPELEALKIRREAAVAANIRRKIRKVGRAP